MSSYSPFLFLLVNVLITTTNAGGLCTFTPKPVKNGRCGPTILTDTVAPMDKWLYYGSGKTGQINVGEVCKKHDQAYRAIVQDPTDCKTRYRAANDLFYCGLAFSCDKLPNSCTKTICKKVLRDFMYNTVAAAAPGYAWNNGCKKNDRPGVYSNPPKSSCPCYNSKKGKWDNSCARNNYSV